MGKGGSKDTGTQRTGSETVTLFGSLSIAVHQAACWGGKIFIQLLAHSLLLTRKVKVTDEPLKEDL